LVLPASVVRPYPLADRAGFTKKKHIEVVDAARPTSTSGITQLIAAQANFLVLKPEAVKAQGMNKPLFLCPPAQADKFAPAVIGMENEKNVFERKTGCEC
jgi:hypothetical protein